jgi:acetyl esterase
MPVHPIARAFLDLPFIKNQKPLHTLSVSEVRAQFLAQGKLMPPGEPVGTVNDLAIPGPDGDIPARIYTPKGVGPFPVHVYFHGGGWVLGNLDSQDFDCRALTNAARCIVVSVNYRHAPEHKFPAPAEDAYSATRWVSENSLQIGGDGFAVTVGGMSAGGNLAASVALMARDRAVPAIACQVLTVPVTNFSFETESYQKNGEAYVLTKKDMEWFWNHYLQTPADGQNPYASPLQADDLSGLPPAFVMTSEYDPLRDEGHAYADRLRDADVPVEYKCYEGMLHMVQGPEALVDMAGHLQTVFTARKGSRV